MNMPCVSEWIRKRIPGIQSWWHCYCRYRPSRDKWQNPSPIISAPERSRQILIIGVDHLIGSLKVWLSFSSGLPSEGDWVYPCPLSRSAIGEDSRVDYRPLCASWFRCLIFRDGALCIELGIRLGSFSPGNFRWFTRSALIIVSYPKFKKLIETNCILLHTIGPKWSFQLSRAKGFQNILVVVWLVPLADIASRALSLHN